MRGRQTFSVLADANEALPADAVAAVSATPLTITATFAASPTSTFANADASCDGGTIAREAMGNAKSKSTG